MKKKLIKIEDKLGIIFTEKEIKKYQLVENDIIDLSDMFLVDVEGIRYE